MNWKIRKVGDSDSYAIIPPDGETAYLVGDAEDMRALTVALEEFELNRFFRSVEPESMSADDPRLGASWISVAEASEKYCVPISTVRTWTRKIETQKRRGRTVMPEKRVRYHVELWKEWKAGSRPHLTKKESE